MTVGGLLSVARWILGFGRHAKPLTPPELVTHVRGEAEAIVGMLSLSTD